MAIRWLVEKIKMRIVATKNQSCDANFDLRWFRSEAWSLVPALALSLDSAELVHDYTILLLRFNSKVPCETTRVPHLAFDIREFSTTAPLQLS